MRRPGQVEFAKGCVIITGAASGIGRATAVELAACGRDIALLDVDVDAARDTADESRGLGVRAEVFGVDVGDADDVRAAVDTAAAALCGVGAVVPCAGIAELDRAASIDRSVFDRAMRVNLGGVINVVEAAVPYLRRSGKGAAIAVVSSMEGVNAHPFVASYTMSKHAVNGFVRSAALSLGPEGIRINAVCPGPVDTAMFASGAHNSPEEVAKHNALIASLPMGYVARPEEVATVLKFLVSSDSSYVNGAALVIDGGRSVQ